MLLDEIQFNDEQLTLIDCKSPYTFTTSRKVSHHPTCPTLTKAINSDAYSIAFFIGSCDFLMSFYKFQDFKQSACVVKQPSLIAMTGVNELSLHQ